MRRALLSVPLDRLREHGLLEPLLSLTREASREPAEADRSEEIKSMDVAALLAMARSTAAQ
ncbi:hypothetical protein [Streptomyces hilarionis]|uniref:hypothetical protein n=1 Tax=Streptomyces hilarionis TaxID=2839954 RepID=UPI00211A3A6B|nr:hypothetical protein [Streptomyces hilarionis]MCQ9130128.1 hypothetical protein [Streptomyces hilarionis]